MSLPSQTEADGLCDRVRDSKTKTPTARREDSPEKVLSANRNSKLLLPTPATRAQGEDEQQGGASFQPILPQKPSEARTLLKGSLFPHTPRTSSTQSLTFSSVLV